MNQHDMGWRVWFCSALLALSAGAPIVAVAAPTGESDLLQTDGSGINEFEAVKGASKQILATALRRVLGRAATLDEPVRRRLERDIEENFRQTRTRFFSAMDRQCKLAERVTCNVRAAVNMNELRAAVSTYLDQGAANRLRVAMTVDRGRVRGVDTENALAFIHNALELQLGYDVYFVDTFIPLEELRGGCRGYEARIADYRARSGSFARVLRQLKTAQAVCDELRDREAVIVVEDIAMNVGRFDPGRGLLSGTVRPTLKFFRTDSRRPLPSPLPLEITKYGEGSSPREARADLNNRMYQDVANYIGQQFSEIVLSRQVRGRAAQRAASSRQSTLRITGVSRDAPAGREALQRIERWFVSYQGGLHPQLALSGREEHVYTWQPGSSANVLTLTDRLRTVLSDANLPATVDIDRWQGITIAFSGEQALAVPVLSMNDRRIKRAFAIERELNTMRQDQATGVAMAVNVADISLRNKKRRGYVVTIDPVWRDATGVVIDTDFSQRVLLSIEGKATRGLRFRAPSRSAVAVEIVVQCRNRKCE